MQELFAARIRDFRLPRFHELPNVGLYLEQVTKYISDSLQPLGGLAITGSMISNYVKRGLVSANAVRYMKKLVVANIGIVLAKAEEKLVTVVADTQLDDGCIPAPDYLTMEPIDVSLEELPN